MNWTYDSGDFAATSEGRAATGDFDARRTAASADGKLRGLGIAHYIKGVRAGAGEVARLEISTDGDATIFIGNQSNGQGHETVFAQAVSQRLGIEPDKIKLVQGDTDRRPPEPAAHAWVNGIPACDNAAVAVIENGTRFAADAMKRRRRISSSRTASSALPAQTAV